MLNKVFSLAARVTNFLETHKHEPRRTVNFSLRVSLAGPCRNGSGPLPPSFSQRLTLKGCARDISESGLALVLPAVHLGGLYFTNGERKLYVSLDLDDRTLELEVLPVRYEQLSDAAGYLVGAKIVAMSERDRAAFSDVLHGARQPLSFAAPARAEATPLSILH